MSNNITSIHSSPSASPVRPAESASGLQKGFRAFLAGTVGNPKALLGVTGMVDWSKLGDRLSGAYNSLAQATSHQAQKDIVLRFER